MARFKMLLLVLLLAATMLLAACDNDDDDDNDAQQDDDATDDDTSVDDDATGDDGEALILAMADTWMADNPAEQLGWSWDSGVLQLGMWDLSLVTGETKYAQYVQDWIDHYIETGYTFAYNDHVPPARLALRLWQKTGDAKYRQVVDDALVYIFEKAERLPDGGLNHMGWISGNQIWADTLFMVTPFEVETGVADNDNDCFDDAVLQFEVFADHLRDADTGMYRHMYDADADAVKPTEKDYWGRGNAWIIAASGIALQKMPSTHEGYAGIRERFVAQSEAMAALMDDQDYRWPTIMNRPETYLETSVGPLWAYGQYMAYGADVPENLRTAAEKALAGAINQIVEDEHGNTLLLGTSYGTGPSTWEMYNYVLKGEQVSYGLGATLLAWCAWKQNGGEALNEAYLHDTDETFIHEPTDNDATAWGYFNVARGDFFEASDFFAQALTADPNNADANIGQALIEAIRYAFGVLDSVDRYMLKEIGLFDLIDEILLPGRELGQNLAGYMASPQNDENFNRVIERLVIAEQGGSTAVGRVEVDRGEAFLLDGVGRLIWGVADVYDGLLGDLAALKAFVLDPFSLLSVREEGKDNDQIVSGLDEMIDSVDLLIEAIETIMAETDDQSDDLLPANLFALEGEFGIPGVLYPEPVTQLLDDLGIGGLFEGKTMPDYLIELLGTVKSVLSLVRTLLGILP